MSVTNMADNTNARRNQNLQVALFYAGLGLAVFPSSGKTPLIPRFQLRDTDIGPEDREAAIEKFKAEHDDEVPVHVGASSDPAVVKKMFRRHRDAVPSISCGPSKLVAIDADVKFNGPEKIAALFEEIGLPEGVIISTTRSGGKHYIFANPDGKFTNKAGLLKKNFGCDVRGAGGQFVAPGAIREDGKTYGDKDTRIALARAIAKTSTALPTLPDAVAELIGSAGVEYEDVKPSQERDIIKQIDEGNFEIADAEWGALGEYSVDQLKTLNHEFKQLYDNPTPDCSTNRFKIARMVMAQWPQMSPPALASFLSQWEGSGTWTEDKPQTGEYDNRQVAREWLKNQGLTKPSDGAALDAIEDDEKAAFFANGGSEESWDDWQERIARQREQRRARVERQRARTDEQTEGGEAQGVQSNGKKSRLADRFVYIADIRGKALRFLDWCLKFVIARGTTSMVTGLWGSGKTAVFSDIGLHVGHGFDWRGRKVTQGVVIYVALENSDDVERRVATWCDLMTRAGRDVSNGAFVVYRGPCRLFDPSGRPTRDEKDLIELAMTAAEHYGLPVAMIVIDTLAQSIAPGDDNSAKDAGIYTAAMQRIVAATGANVTALAHPTKQGEGVRGSGALVANVDTVIEISRDAAGRGTIKAGSKFRIGNPSKVRFGYRLQSHVIAKDPDGDDIDVVLAVDVPTGPDMGIDEDADDAALTPPDGPADKLAATLRVFRERVEAVANDTGEAASEIGLSSGEVFRLLNADRKTCGLEELKDRTVVTRLLGRLVEAGEIVRSGDNRRTEYRLADSEKQ